MPNIENNKHVQLCLNNAKLEKIHEQAEILKGSIELQTLINAVPNPFMILNAKRQIIFANENVADFLKIDNSESIIGKCPGELFDCIHSYELATGCGTAAACEFCGTKGTIFKGFAGKTTVNESRMQIGDGTEAMDLMVSVTPFVVKNDRFLFFSIQDNSAEKRRAILEKIFFHDIINIADGLRGISNILLESPDEYPEFKYIISELSNSLIDEILGQKQLLAAESSELAVKLAPVNSMRLINTVIDAYKNNMIAENKSLIIDPAAIDVDFTSDETLARRILGNMTKNALEASRDGQSITLSCSETPNSIDFTVHNETVMPREIQLQMFQRSFSTKGSDRGIGTYSMKLLLEKYLKGKISFTSEEGEGTTFVASFPKS